LNRRYTAISIATGEPAGQWYSDERVEGTPLGRTLLGVGCERLEALDATTGRSVWSAPGVCQSEFRPNGLTASRFKTTVALSGGLLSGMGRSGPQVIDPVTGTVRWHGSADVGLAGLVPVGDGTVVVLTDVFDFAGVSLSDGSKRWTVTTSKDMRHAVPYHLGGFAVAGGLLVYEGTEIIRKNAPRVLRVVDAATGAERWFVRDRALVGVGDGWVFAARTGGRHGGLVQPAQVDFYVT
jgi:outer membrane protein assembly factor BamB